MITFEESYTKVQKIAGDESDAALIQFKDDINQGAHKINAAMNRYFTRKSKTADLVADQQYYQLPPDAIKPMGVVATVDSSSEKYPLKQIRSETEWRAINSNTQTGNWITFYFVRGSDEIGLYPIPSDTVTDGLEVYYAPRDRDLSQADFSDGTVTVSEGDATVTHSGTGFTSAMVGRAFKVTDGSDGHAYRVASLTNSSTIELEEPYIGISGSGKSFKIGETYVFPDEFHDAPIDYALARFFEQADNENRAAYHLSKFDAAKEKAKEEYASSSTSMLITGETEAFNWFLVPPEPTTGG